MTLLRDTAALAPMLTSGPLVFVSGVDAPTGVRPQAMVEEAEGTTLVLPADAAQAAGLDGQFRCRRITLGEATDLAATGIMAGVSRRLAEAGIPCNPLAGFHHDHLLVPEAQAEQALAVLQAPADAWDLIQAWFGPLDANGCAGAQARRRWFAGGPEFDEQLRRRFGNLHDRALAGDLTAWQASLFGRLALVLLLDQLSRNLHRSSALAFAGDARALALAQVALDGGDLDLLPWDCRPFLLLPLEHAEDVQRQVQSIAGFETLATQAPDYWAEQAANYLEHAREHAALVARFGRFPHRNQALGRDSTTAEAAWLAENHKRFGQ